MDKRGKKRNILGIIPFIVLALSSIGIIDVTQANWQETNILKQDISTGVLSVVGDTEYDLSGGIELQEGNPCMELDCYYEPNWNPSRMPITIEISQTEGIPNSTYVTIKALRVSFRIKNEGTLPAKYIIKENDNLILAKGSYLRVIENTWLSEREIKDYDVWVNKPDGGRDRLSAMKFKNQNIILPGQSIECYAELPLKDIKKIRIAETILETQVCMQFEPLSENAWKDDTCNSIAVKRPITDRDISKTFIADEVIYEEPNSESQSP